MGWAIEGWHTMRLTRRTLLQSLAALLPLSALGLGGSRTNSATLPAPPEGVETPEFVAPVRWVSRDELEEMITINGSAMGPTLSGPDSPMKVPGGYVMPVHPKTAAWLKANA